MGRSGGPAAYIVDGEWKGTATFREGPMGSAARDLHRVARQVLKLRRNLGLSQEEVAQRAGVAVRSIHELENGTAWPSSKTLGAVAWVLKARLGVFQLKSSA